MQEVARINYRFPVSRPALRITRAEASPKRYPINR
jgi:hypothetical protein